MFVKINSKESKSNQIAAKWKGLIFFTDIRSVYNLIKFIFQTLTLMAIRLPSENKAFITLKYP